MDLPAFALLVGAGLAAGTVNAAAGGGSLITFPALIAVGLPPVSANVTNAIAVCPGYVASTVGSRDDLPRRRGLWRLVPTAVAGAVLGCVLLLITPPRAFELIVPFLVISAAAVLGFQNQLRRIVGEPKDLPAGREQLSLQAMTFFCAAYGGYFGAALGVMLVAGLALVLDEALNGVVALKNLLSAAVGVTTVAVFAIFGPVDWVAAVTVAPATIVGGYVGARVVRKLPPTVLRFGIVAFGVGIGVLLLARALR
ncbi:sulfite exporter TauE/SafE family protein [Solwaraspora sp. WMMD792]|uniref:sulfite exporter TauE/SafE family protein n=1 Tax=Solwaraspora sp. WMMD792 TaxID=3016099 RepID=UPI002416D41C|nr:sulfite exporter TauE/SafE family protein [Solwaraspora sp. WMMD792]MDG4772169.1 sulfite exporter TauE/SafE family protein [Solwaraspora sp. WMMD792]